MFKYKFTNILATRIFQKIVSSYKFREPLYRNNRDLFVQPLSIGTSEFQLYQVPPQYRTSKMQAKLASHYPAVFVTARFRSGSTFLWNIFRQLKEITCYYEPLHERRWAKKENKLKMDNTHVGVTDYEIEFQGLRHLKQIFDPVWANRFLYMDKTHHNPNMKHYLSSLIEHAGGLPVLQFNRVDFRLEWLKANFPEAKIVHLYRDPREQWMSIIHKGDFIEKDIVYQQNQLDGGNDFYTLEWARDLRHVFPFLDPYGRHPYEIHYLLWRLSYSFGKTFSDISIGYEELVSDFTSVVERLFGKLGIQTNKIDSLKILNKGATKSRWHQYATESWFRSKEENCDNDIEVFFNQSTRVNCRHQ